MNKHYYRTLYSCYIGYITQAIIVNLAPLLFVIFQREYHFTIAQIGFLVTFNFGVQILVDYLSAKYVERLGYKPCIIAAHIFCMLGLLGLGTLPDWLPSAYAGILLSVAVYAIGGGLLEVLVSPIVEALPLDQKSSAMSLLHSFYCWGHVLVVALSTVFFQVFGTVHWRILPVLWSIVPFLNVFMFASSPIKPLTEEGQGLSIRKLFSMKLFWIFAMMMICSGASEQAMSQWASYFAESGLKVSKTVGDLLGPCMFAIMMGITRTFYGMKGETISLEKFITGSSVLCVASYLVAVFAPHPILSLIGCGVCGLSVGIMWPGVFSLVPRFCPQGGTAMFALLALAGDVGCSLGPSLVGGISNLADNNLKIGLFTAIAFPILLIIGIRLLKKRAFK